MTAPHAVWGANGATCAIAIARFGVPVAILAVVGDEDTSHRVLEPAPAAGDADRIRRRSGGLSTATAMLVARISTFRRGQVLIPGQRNEAFFRSTKLAGRADDCATAIGHRRAAGWVPVFYPATTIPEGSPWD